MWYYLQILNISFRMKLAFSLLNTQQKCTQQKYAHLCTRICAAAVCIIAKNGKKIKYQQNKFCLCIKLNTMLENKIKYHAWKCNTTATQQHKLRGKEQWGETGNVVHGQIFQELGSSSKEIGVFDPSDDKGTDRFYGESNLTWFTSFKKVALAALWRSGWDVNQKKSQEIH